MTSLAPAPRTSQPSKPPPDCPTASRTLWLALLPDVRRRIAREYAAMMVRMRAARFPATPEIPHADGDDPR
ncbi:hypothetical protein [Skermanella aerolata]|uniref:hypothetical protein n=1 Tax=Skermanella aerolata TaxID=393310 RepID=UPI001649D325|nr:hypothetical protein [Skermanella aerolata]